MGTGRPVWDAELSKKQVETQVWPSLEIWMAQKRFSGTITLVAIVMILQADAPNKKANILIKVGKLQPTDCFQLSK